MAEEERQIVEARRRGRLALFWAGLSRNKTALFGLAVIGLFIVVAVAAPQIAPHDPNETNLPNMIAGPSLEYPLGTDELGRCILSRIIYGARISLSIGLMVIAIGVGVGAPLGVASAYYGGKLDFLMQRLEGIARGKEGQKYRAAELFTGLLAEQHAAQQEKVSYRFIRTEPSLLLDAIRSSFSVSKVLISCIRSSKFRMFLELSKEKRPLVSKGLRYPPLSCRMKKKSWGYSLYSSGVLTGLSGGSL